MHCRLKLQDNHQSQKSIKRLRNLLLQHQLNQRAKFRLVLSVVRSVQVVKLEHCITYGRSNFKLKFFFNCYYLICLIAFRLANVSITLCVMEMSSTCVMTLASKNSVPTPPSTSGHPTQPTPLTQLPSKPAQSLRNPPPITPVRNNLKPAQCVNS